MSLEVSKPAKLRYSNWRGKGSQLICRDTPLVKVRVGNDAEESD